MDGYGMDISMLRGPVVKVVLVSSPIGGRRGGSTGWKRSSGFLCRKRAGPL